MIQLRKFNWDQFFWVAADTKIASDSQPVTLNKDHLLF